MKNPRFVGCSWFIGLIGLGSEFPELKYLNKYDPSVHSLTNPLFCEPLDCICVDSSLSTCTYSPPMHSSCISVDSFLSTHGVHRTHTLYRSAPEHFSAARALDDRAHTVLSHTYGRSNGSIPGAQLLQAARGATSAHGSCKQCAVRPRRFAAHFFPHTRPPDTHAHPSPQHSTFTHSLAGASPQYTTFTHTLAVVAACLVYERLLVNSYCTSDPCRPRGLARPPSASCARRVFRPQQNV
jgi:hypothetical protein